MPPKAIVLVALLIPEQACRGQTSTADDDSARQAKPQLMYNHKYCMALCCVGYYLHSGHVRMKQKMLALCAPFPLRRLSEGSILCDFVGSSFCSGPNAEASTSGQSQEEQNAILVGTVELSFAASTRARYLTLNAPVVSYTHNFALESMFTVGRMDNRMTSYVVKRGNHNSWTSPHLYTAAHLHTMTIGRALIRPFA